MRRSSGGPPAPYLPDDLEEKLKERLESGNSAALCEYADAVLERNYANNVTYEAYLSACIVINRFVARMAQGRDGMARIDLIRINSNGDVYTCERCREIVLSNLKVAVSLFERSSTAAVTVLDQVTCYVEEHFAESINLDTMAQTLGYTPNHLSRYFKQKRGVNFTDYLNSRRVVFARELLASTTLTLNEVAHRSGFSSANMLIRAYEKYEGVTPGEYRRSLKTAKG